MTIFLKTPNKVAHSQQQSISDSKQNLSAEAEIDGSQLLPPGSNRIRQSSAGDINPAQESGLLSVDERLEQKELKYQRLRGIKQVAKEGLEYTDYKKALYEANREEMLNREKRFNRKIKGLQTPQQYLKDLSFKIKLDRLYEIKYVSNINQESKFCALTMGTNQETRFTTIGKKNKHKQFKYPENCGQDENHTFLTQAWSRDGICVYETWTEKPVTNMYISKNILIFVHPERDPENQILPIYVVNLDLNGKTSIISFKIMQERLPNDDSYILGMFKFQNPDPLAGEHKDYFINFNERDFCLLLSKKVDCVAHQGAFAAKQEIKVNYVPIKGEIFKEALLSEEHKLEIIIEDQGSTSPSGSSNCVMKTMKFPQRKKGSKNIESCRLIEFMDVPPSVGRHQQENKVFEGLKKKLTGDLVHLPQLESDQSPREDRIQSLMSPRNDRNRNQDNISDNGSYDPAREISTWDNRCFMVLQLQSGQMGYYWLDHITEIGTARLIEISDSITQQHEPDSADQIIDVKNMVIVQNGTQQHYGVALLETGGIQFYHNYRLVEHCTPSCKADQFSMTENIKKYGLDQVFDQDQGDTQITSIKAQFPLCINIDMDFFGVYYRLIYIDEEQFEFAATFCSSFAWEHRVGFRTGQPIRMNSDSESYITPVPEDVNQISHSHVFQGKTTNKSLNISSLRNRVEAKDLQSGGLPWKIPKKALQLRVGQFVKLYSSFIYHANYMFVSHRNIVSVYDVKRDDWMLHSKFDDTIRHLFRHEKAKDENISDSALEINDVGIVVGNNQIQFYELVIGELGKLEFNKYKQEINYKESRILHIKQDHKDNSKIYLIVEEPFQVEDKGHEKQGIMKDLDEYTKIRSDSMKRDSFFGKTCTDVIQNKKKLFSQALDPHIVAEIVNQPMTSLHVIDTENTKTILIDCVSSGQYQGKVQWEEEEPVVTWETARQPLKSRNLADEAEQLLTLSIEERVADEQYFKKGLNRLLARIFLTPDLEIPEGGRKLIMTLEVREDYIKLTPSDKILGKELGYEEQTFHGRNIREVLHVDQYWLYALADPHEYYDNQLHKQSKAKLNQMRKNLVEGEELEGEEDLMEEAQSGWTRKPGMYVYDLSQMLKGHVETYQLSDAIAGQNNLIDFSHSKKTITFSKNFNTIQIIPLIHRNVSQFFGMDPISEFLIWREEAGHLIAVTKKNLKLKIWSKYNGKIEVVQKLNKKFKLDEFRIYDGTFEGEDGKIRGVRQKTYYDDWFQFEEYSLSLVCRQVKAESLNTDELQMTQFFDQNHVRHKRYMHGVEGVLFEFLILMFKDGVFSVEAKFSKFLYLDAQEKAELPLLWLSKPKQTRSAIEKYKFKILLVNKHDMAAVILNIKPPNEGENFIKPGEIYEECECTQMEVINRFTDKLRRNSEGNFLFSPNLEQFIDVDYGKDEFLIRSTRDMEILFKIPVGLFSPTIAGKSVKKSSKQMASRMKLLDNDKIRFISQNGVDCIYQMQKDPEEDKKTIMVLQSQCFCSNFGTTDDEQFNDRHAIIDRQRITSRETLPRLMRLYRDIKEYIKTLETNSPTEIITDQEYKDHIADKVFRKIFQVEYQQRPYGDLVPFIRLQRTFSILDWLIINRLRSSRGVQTFDLESVDKETKLNMCFNVLPNQKNILHYIGIGDITDPSTIKELFTNAATPYDGMDKRYIPYFRDRFGHTPIEYSLVNFQQKQQEQSDDEEQVQEILHQSGLDESGQKDDSLLSNQDTYQMSQKEVQVRQEFALSQQLKRDRRLMEDKFKRNLVGIQKNAAQELMEHMKNYPLGHFSNLLTADVTLCIKHDVFGCPDFIQSRLKKSTQLCNEDKMKLGVLKKSIKLGQRNYTAISQPVYADVDDLSANIFKSEGYEKELTYSYLDLYGIEQAGPLRQNFFQELLRSQNESFMSQEIIQIITDNSYEPAKPYIIYYEVLPYVIWLALFWTWSVFFAVPDDILFQVWRGENSPKTFVEITPDDSLPDFIQTSYFYGRIICVAQLILSFYFLILEVLQMAYMKEQYLQKLANKLELITIVITVVIGVLYMNDRCVVTNLWYCIFSALASFLLWFKSTTYFYMSEDAGKFYTMLIQVHNRLKAFYFLFMVFTIASGSAFYSINTFMFSTQEESAKCLKSGVDNKQWLKSWNYAILFSYFTSLGEFDTSAWDCTGFTDIWTQRLAWFIFIATSFTNLIIILNLLIAVINDGYSWAKQREKELTYQLRAQAIRDVQAQSFGSEKRPNNFLLIVSEKKSIDTKKIRDKSTNLDRMVDTLGKIRENAEVVQNEFRQ